MKLTPDDIVMCLKFRHVRTYEDIMKFYEDECSHREIFKALAIGVKRGLIRIDKTSIPYQYHPAK